MKRFKVTWECKDGSKQYKKTVAISEIHAVAYVERLLGATPIRGTTTMLSDGFITQFKVEETLS